MSFWEAIVLGIIQGLTEFLPVSSSGHLALAQYFFGIKEPVLFFDIMLHVGTVGAVFLVFRRDIWDILSALYGREPLPRRDSSQQMTRSAGRTFAWLIIVGTVPTVIIALVLNMFIEKLFVNPLFISCMLVVTGMILWLSGRFCPSDNSHSSLNFTKALIVGIAQGIAALPGISRSGATISTAIMTGVKGEEAARYSLLLSIPAILGATALKAKDVTNIGISIWIIVFGTLAAFLVGYLAIKLLLRTLKKGRFSRFAYYCWAIGVLGILGYILE